MSNYLGISEEIYALGQQAEREIMPYFTRLDETCDHNTEKVLAAFAKNRVSDNLFAGTTGYGYDDHGPIFLERSLHWFASALSTARMRCRARCFLQSRREIRCFPSPAQPMTRCKIQSRVICAAA